MPSTENDIFTEVETLDDLILAANQALESTVMYESNRAFNLGLRTWLIPGGLIILAVFVFSKINWAMVGIAAALVGLTAVVFAIFVASRSKMKSPARIYQTRLFNDINQKLSGLGNIFEEFVRRAPEVLPAEALLLQTLPQPDPDVNIHHPTQTEESE